MLTIPKIALLKISGYVAEHMTRKINSQI